MQWKESAASWDTPADVSEATVTGAPHTINGLTEGVKYAVRVIAVNAVGDGTPSAEATGTPRPRDTEPPELADGGLGVDGATLRISYNEALDEDSVPAVDAFVLKVVGKGDSFTWHSERARRELNGVTVTGRAVELTLATAVVAGDRVVLRYSPPTDEAASRIRDVAGNAAPGIVAIQVANDTPDTTPPELAEVRVNWAKLILTYDEALDGDPVPATAAFEVTVGGEGRGVDGVAVSGSRVTLTLASAVAVGDTVTVSYTAPPEDPAARIRDLAGNAAPSFSRQMVGNDTKPPLTASYHNQPKSHDGQKVFTFELRFSDEPHADFSYKTLRDHAFTVAGGKITRSPRLDKPSNMTWLIHVRPDSDAGVLIVLPITTDCNAQSAICAADGRGLSNRLEFTVKGPS